MPRQHDSPPTPAATSPLDRDAIFTSPEDVLADTILTVTQKVDLLQRWNYDASEVAVAEEEGMLGVPGDDDDLQRRTRLALEQLTWGAVETAPTKQHGIERVTLR
jgi:hypothetical protein